jgi:hypothetical protein
MAKLMSAPELLRSAAQSGSIPETAEITRRGEATWIGKELAYSAWITKNKAGSLDWYVNIGDAKFSQIKGANQFVGVVRVRSLKESIAWPEKGESGVVTSFCDELRGGVSFIHDRRDLAEVLASKSDVARGHAYAWLPPANYPSRLVQAFILAQEMSLPDLAKMIQGELLQEDFVLADRSRLEMKKVAQQWARQYSKDLGIAVNISEPIRS